MSEIRDDAKRLQRIRNNFFAPTKWDTQYDRDVHFLLGLLDARDAALREARGEIENLKSDAANDAGQTQSYKRAIAELYDVLGIKRGDDPWPDFVDRLREHSAAKDAVVAAARRMASKMWLDDDHYLVEAIARLDAAFGKEDE